MSLPDKSKKYTYADCLKWPEEERWEIIDGVPYLLSSPTWQHQALSLELSRQFSNYLINKPCRVFTAPFDLRIPESAVERDEDCSNVFQPDILVVCDSSRLKGTGYFGVPDLIIEISSPSTTKHDKILKFNKYEKAGVKEYWIVEPDGRVISIFRLQDNGRYGRMETFSEDDIIKVQSFPGLEIDVKSVFAQIPAPEGYITIIKE